MCVSTSWKCCTRDLPTRSTGRARCCARWFRRAGWAASLGGASTHTPVSAPRTRRPGDWERREERWGGKTDLLFLRLVLRCPLERLAPGGKHSGRLQSAGQRDRQAESFLLGVSWADEKINVLDSGICQL